MTQIELVPDLSHCIETVAKQEYRQRLQEYLKRGEENPELEERIELLKRFLETADFHKLRRESEKHLVEGKRVKFIITLQGGELTHELKTF